MWIDRHPTSSSEDAILFPSRGGVPPTLGRYPLSRPIRETPAHLMTLRSDCVLVGHTGGWPQPPGTTQKIVLDTVEKKNANFF